ncbi:MAG: tRNA dihydrouridine(20/20a) synthase DusA [Myxococcota bacterium]
MASLEPSIPVQENTTPLRRPHVLRPVSVAPMMARTDRHFRIFMRQITRHTLLYTEMITTGAILHGDRDRLLGYTPKERPLSLQVGGDDPVELAECARIAEDWGYDEINLNIGCPSDRVQKGNFGVCLMGQPDTVARGVEAMRRACTIPVTVKHRIGFDDRDRYDDMKHFVTTVADAGCTWFTVHARKAWLKGLSPKENRNVPPLRYHEVYRLKQEVPHLGIEINGGVRTVSAVQTHLDHVDAVMIGRAAWDDPYLFAPFDAVFFGADTPAPSRHEVVERTIPHIERELSAGTRLSYLVRPMLSLFNHRPGTRRWKRHLSEKGFKPDADIAVLHEALSYVPR